MTGWPRGLAVRRDAGLYGYERALWRLGFSPVAGADEAGRGACAGPLVVAAVMLPEGRRGQVPELGDSKLLTTAARERVYDQVLARALAWSTVVIPAEQVDSGGLHRMNVEGMRRAVAGLPLSPAYVLTDGFPVTGLGVPGLAVWKGDRVSACVAAASVLAKVTRDRLMHQLHERWPEYDFATHKGYATPVHQQALERHGPCPEHRFSYVNVARCTEEFNSGEWAGGLELAPGSDEEVDGVLAVRWPRLAVVPARRVAATGDNDADAARLDAALAREEAAEVRGVFAGNHHQESA